MAYGITGVQVHDAWFVAAMNVHMVTHLLTFNVTDFARTPVSRSSTRKPSSGSADSAVLQKEKKCSEHADPFTRPREPQ